MKNDNENNVNSPDEFDRAMWAMRDLPDVVHTKPTTLVVTSKERIGADTFIIQTYRQREVGDTIFLQHVSGDRAIRIVIPARVADTIARQRDQLTGKTRSKAAQAVAEDRKLRGIQPAFLKKNTGQS